MTFGRLFRVIGYRAVYMVVCPYGPFWKAISLTTGEIRIGPTDQDKMEFIDEVR